MHVVAIGFNYKNTPISIREALAFDRERAITLSKTLTSQEVIEECMVLSTCNRTEIYCIGSCVDGVKETVYQVLSEKTGCEVNELVNLSYNHNDSLALKHMFRVAASLDAMVVGETQILGQFKSSYQTAAEYNTVGSYLHKACHSAFRVAKRVRTETEIASLPVSVGTLAAELAEKEFGNLGKADVLIIGSGEMGALCANHIKERGAAHILIANRSFPSAEQLSKSVGGIVIPFEEYGEHLKAVDIVITSIGGGKLIEKENIQNKRPLVIIDLAIPRNVDESVASLTGVKLYNIDDLQGLADKNLLARKEAAINAEKIVEEESETAFMELRQIKLAPLLSNLQNRCKEIVTAELDRLYSANPELTTAEKEAVKICTENVVKKILHDPIRLAKEELARPGTNGKEISKTLQNIFRIEN